MQSPVKAVVINLVRRADRYLYFCQQCPHNDVERFKAVDKRHIKLTKSNKAYCEKSFTSYQDLILGHNIKQGELGCFLSHVCIWESFLNDKESGDYLIVYEDDAIFCEHYDTKLRTVLDELKTIENFDTIVYIGGRFMPNFVAQNVIPVTDTIVKTDYSNWNPVHHDRTTHAYIISKQCCRLLLDSLSNDLNDSNDSKESNDQNDTKKYWKKGPIDHFMVGVLRHLEKDIYHSTPLLCHSPMVGDSDIR